MRTVKLILGTLCLACFLGTAVAQEESVKFFGNVKSVKETTYKATEKFGEAIKGKVLNTAVWKYDDKGRLVEEPYYYYSCCYKRWGRPISLTDKTAKGCYKYDVNGNKIEQLQYDSLGVQESRITWSYNEKKQKIEENEYDSDRKLISKTKWKYNDFGNVVDKSKFDGKGDLLEKDEYKYDKNRCLEHSKYAARKDYNGSESYHYRCFGHVDTVYNQNEIILRWRCVYTYNEKGKEIQALLLRHDDTLCVRTNKYDIQENLIEIRFNTVRYVDRTERLIENKYNEKGILIEQKEYDQSFTDYWQPTTYAQLSYTTYRYYNDDGIIQEDLSYCCVEDGYGELRKYDKKGNVIKEFKFSPADSEAGNWVQIAKKELDGEKTEYSYTFDKHDNWIKKLVYVTGWDTPTVCTEIVEREIEYWE